MTSNITFRFAGDASPLKKTSNDVHKTLAGMSKAAGAGSGAMGKLGNSMLSAFSPANLASGPLAGAAAIGAVAGMATKAFDIMIDASKKYFDEQKSITVLNTALINNTNLTNAQIEAVNSQIDSLSMLAAVQDDDLRQSYANIVASVKDTDASMRLLQIATDVSAGSGLNLEKVSKALTKAYNGNSGALQKMLPGVQAGKAGIDELADSYKGAGEAVGDASPFERINLAMENISETLGSILAPLIQQFAEWLTSEDFQKFMDMMTASAIDMAVGFSEAMQPFMDMLDFFGSEQFQFLMDSGKAMQGFTTGGGIFGGIFGSFNKPEAEETTSFVDNLTNGIQALRDKLGGLKDFKFKAKDVVPKPEVVEVAKRIKDAAKAIADSGKQFKESLNFGEFLDKDTNVFDAKKFQEKFRAIVAAAKALPGKLKALRKAGASPEVLQQVLAMGPEQGLAVANGFLSNAGSAKEYSKSLNTLSTLGQKSAVEAGTQNTYQINVTKANMTAEEIITAIQKYERKTGKKVVF